MMSDEEFTFGTLAQPERETEMDNEELLAYCEMLENIIMERGINADFMWKAKKAMEKLDKIYGLYSVEMPALERCREIQKVIDDAE